MCSPTQTHYEKSNNPLKGKIYTKGKTFGIFKITISIKNIIRMAEEDVCGRPWSLPSEQRVFEDVRVVISGDHDTYTRRVLVVGVDDVECSPGHILLPAVRINIGRLRNRTFIILIGKFYA